MVTAHWRRSCRWYLSLWCVSTQYFHWAMYGLFLLKETSQGHGHTLPSMRLSTTWCFFLLRRVGICNRRKKPRERGNRESMENFARLRCSCWKDIDEAEERKKECQYLFQASYSMISLKYYRLTTKRRNERTRERERASEEKSVVNTLEVPSLWKKKILFLSSDGVKKFKTNIHIRVRTTFSCLLPLKKGKKMSDTWSTPSRHDSWGDAFLPDTVIECERKKPSAMQNGLMKRSTSTIIERTKHIQTVQRITSGEENLSNDTDTEWRKIVGGRHDPVSRWRWPSCWYRHSLLPYIQHGTVSLSIQQTCLFFHHFVCVSVNITFDASRSSIEIIRSTFIEPSLYFEWFSSPPLPVKIDAWQSVTHRRHDLTQNGVFITEKRCPSFQ